MGFARRSAPGLAAAGNVALSVTGTTTVVCRTIVAGSTVLLTNTAGGGGPPTIPPTVSVITAGTGFTIGNDAGDVGMVMNYAVINP